MAVVRFLLERAFFFLILSMHIAELYCVKTEKKRKKAKQGEAQTCLIMQARP